MALAPLIVCFKIGEGWFKANLAFLEGLAPGFLGSAKGVPLEFEQESGSTLSSECRRRQQGSAVKTGAESLSLPRCRSMYLCTWVREGDPRTTGCMAASQRLGGRRAAEGNANLR